MGTRHVAGMRRVAWVRLVSVRVVGVERRMRRVGSLLEVSTIELKIKIVHYSPASGEEYECRCGDGGEGGGDPQHRRC